MTLAERFREHAAACDRMGAPLYGALMRGMADDWDAHGVVREICAGWENASEADVIQLRFLGGLHRLVLTGNAPELVPYYPNLGGTRAPEGAWEVAASVVAEHRTTLRAALGVVPQTNEVGRTVPLVLALYAAAAEAGRHRVRLLEVGASAGLNLLVDSYRIVAGDWSWGPSDAPVRIEARVEGSFTPVPVEIVARRGCDLDPIDPTTDDGRLRLRSFIWPDNVERYRRLDGALEAAARQPALVDKSEATSWLRERLAEPVGDDVLTVVWHSVVWQYLSPGQREEAEVAIATAAEHLPLVHAGMEPVDLRRAAQVHLTLTTYDGGTARTTLLGESHPHGVSVQLRDDATG